MLAGANGNELSLLAHRGPSEVVDAGSDIDAVIREAWARHEPMLIKKLRVEDNRRLASLLLMARNVLVAPLFAEGRPFGVVAGAVSALHDRKAHSGSGNPVRLPRSACAEERVARGSGAPPAGRARAGGHGRAALFVDAPPEDVPGG